jgi:hypothetical protein
MTTLFVLLPEGGDVADVLGGESENLTADLVAQLRRYPIASDAPHMLSLVRDGRDSAATRWLPGLLLAVASGAVIGAILNGILAGFFGMYSGLVSIAIPLGFALGGFLGGFTALMTGTHAALPALKPLLLQAVEGDVLLQWQSDERATLLAIRSCCQQRGVASLLID